MKVAITSTGKELSSNLDPRFGRAPYFIIVDPETMAFEVVENAQNINLPQGAGIQEGKTIAKAFKVLQNAGVKILTGVGGKVADAIEQYKKGELDLAGEADVEGHWV